MDKRCSFPAKKHYEALIKIERETNSLGPDTKRVKMRFQLSEVTERSDFWVNFNVVGKEKNFKEGKVIFNWVENNEEKRTKIPT